MFTKLMTVINGGIPMFKFTIEPRKFEIEVIRPSMGVKMSMNNSCTCVKLSLTNYSHEKIEKK